MKTFSSIEALESRIAPATLVNSTTVTYSDFDGDDIKIKISKPIFDMANLATVLTFSSGAARPDGSIPQHLTAFNVGSFDAGEADKLNITITAKRSTVHGGDGLANISQINATTGNATDLGAVKVQGDIIKISAGDANLTTRALKSLNVLSFGQQDTGETSNIAGPIGKITIRGNMVGELLQTGAGAGIGSFFIGGTFGNGGNTLRAGHIVTQGTIASLRIAHDAIGGFTDSASVAGKIGTLFIGGSLIGGTQANSGIFNVEVQSAVIKGDIIGGTAATTGDFAVTSGTTARIVIGGSVIGSAFDNTGLITTSGGSGSINAIAIGGSLVGGENALSGFLSGRLEKIAIGGDMIGKAFASTGAIISSDSLTSVVVKGSVLGRNGGINSGSISAVTGSIGSVFIGGDLARADIIAGISPGADNQYGVGVGANADFDSDPAINRIGSIVIKGVVIRTTGRFAFEANQIAKLKVGSVNYRHDDPTISYSTGFTIDNDQSILVREI